MIKNLILIAAVIWLQFSPVVAKNINRVEPLFWWVGMQNPNLQIMIYGDDIAKYDIKISDNQVKLLGKNLVDNANYVFINIEIQSNAKAGKFDIEFYKSGKKKLVYNYELKDKDAEINRIKGVSSKDLIYQLMPDRFANGDPDNDIIKSFKENVINRDSMFYRHGGDLKGIINHLDYIKDLGATVIWLTPEVENNMPKASYHGYAATDFYQIDKRFGNNDLYKTFVDAAHQKGLKVIKDVVHNHIGNMHWMMMDLPSKDWIHQWPTYTQTTYKDQTIMDPYASEADKKQMVHGWFVPTMPDLNQENELVQNYITQNIIWWVQFAGIDGLRLDTYPYNYLPYMAKWAKQMKTEFPDLSIFGETLVNTVVSQAYFTQGNSINQNFDTALPGITDVQIKDAIYETLNGKFDWTSGVNKLYTVLSNDFIYKDPSKNVIFLDNHDMSRFFSVVNEDIRKFKSGLAILLTTRGIPQIYYGTEILMKNYANPDGLVRSDFPGGWKEDKSNKFIASGRSPIENEIFDYIKKLANYRKNTSALQTGKLMQFVPVGGVYVYFRYDLEKTIMVVVNTNDKAIDLDVSRFKERLINFTKAINIVENYQYSLSAPLKISEISTQIFELQ